MRQRKRTQRPSRQHRAAAYHKATLDNGLRILTIPMPHTRSAAVGIFCGVGSRYESRGERGVSHFVEHMMFKGTQRRPTAQQVAEAIEGLGGVLNAATGNEMTTYWAKVADHHLPIALDVLLDIFRNSLLVQEEVGKERHVILQEISRLMDVPDSWVHVLIADLIWPDHPVGWEILGTKETVGGIQREHLLDYVARTYTPSNTAISIAGNFDRSQVEEHLRGELAQWAATPSPSFLPAIPAPENPALHIEFKETEQAHLCLGMRGLPLDHPDYYKLRVLNVILGEGMSSRLFLEIRERRGLAYNVGSYASFLSDTGAIVLYAGVAPDKAQEVVRALIEQLGRLCNTPVPPKELTKAREFLKGRILLHLEDTFANAQWFGRQEILSQEVLSVDDVMERLDAVTARDVQDIAQQLIDASQYRLAAIGPFEDKAVFEELLNL